MHSALFPLTKIQPPRVRAALIPRLALERRLQEALASRRLTLVVAPAGFGKTAALTRQLSLLPEPVGVAWIAADEDDDLHRFLACLFAALEPFDLPWRSDPQALIAVAVNGAAERRRVAIELLNVLAASDISRGLIVLDDAHRIDDYTVFEFLDFLLERLPEQWGMVMASRVEPPLSLARLRGLDEVAEIGQRMLRFEQEDVLALVELAGVQADVTALLEHTGGWPAGLRLSLNGVEHGHPPARGYHGMDRHLFEYVNVEVLDTLPAELREFLLRCALLPELTPTRCAAVSGAANAAQLLDELDRRGLFYAAVNGPEPALTLHDLFRNCLVERLRRDEPELLPVLLRRVAETEPEPIRRLNFLQRAGAWEEAELVLESVAAELLAAGAVETVFRLIDQFPPERRAQSPMLALVRGQALWALWDWRGTAAAMAAARRGFERAGDAGRRRRAQIFEAIALLGNGLVTESRAVLADVPSAGADLEGDALAQALRVWQAIDTGDFRQVAPECMALLDLLERTDSLELWYRCFQRPLYVWLPGMQPPLQRFIDGVMRRSGDGSTQMRCIAHVMAAWLALTGGDLARCRVRLNQAADDARWLGMPTRLEFFLDTVSAALHAIEGERDAAFAAVGRLLAYFENAPVSGAPAQATSMFAHYVFFALRLADTLGDGAALRDYAARLPAERQIKNLAMLRAPLESVRARLAAWDGDYMTAVAVWQALLADERAIDVLGLAQEARVRCAWALLALGRAGEAAAVLVPVLRFVSRTGEVGGVLLAGRAVLTDLSEQAWAEALEETELAALRGCLRLLDPGRTGPNGGNGASAETQLTPRELEVLSHIAAGDSNKLIARALDLSPHTVKRHVANILDKLDLCSRRDAAAWYRSHW